MAREDGTQVNECEGERREVEDLQGDFFSAFNSKKGGFQL
jgi:hypothetical protein